MSNNNSPLDYDPLAKEKFVITDEIKQQYYKLGVTVSRFALISTVAISIAFLLLGAHIYNNLAQSIYTREVGEYSTVYLYITIILWVAAISLFGIVGRYGNLLKEFAKEGTEKALKEVLEQKMLIFVVGSLIQFAMVLAVGFLLLAA